ncbi:MAG: MFS transporter [Anaerolineales bacterium]|nr:MFS transporter [Anaerolineales bacterium]
METIAEYDISIQNERHLYLDILYWGILGGSTISFLGIFLARTGATNFQLSLVSAGPALVSLLFSIPAGRYLEARSFVRTTYITSILHRGGYVLMLVGMLIFAQDLHVTMILTVTVLMSVPGTVLMIGFNAAFAELVAPDRRGLVVGRRNALLAVSMTASALISGQLLDWIAFPLNYQIVFGIGILGGLLSSYELGRLKGIPAGTPVPRVGRPILDHARPGRVGLPWARRYVPGTRFLTRGIDALRPDLLRGEFGVFLGAMFFFYVAQNIVVPLFPIYQVDTMALSDSAISIGTAVFQVTVFATSMQLGRLTQRFGHHHLMVVSVLGYACFPLFIGLQPTVSSYMAGAAVGGIGWGILGGALANRLMERVPEDDRPSHMALFNIVLNLGVLCGSLLGPLSGDLLGVREALVVGGSLRLISSLVLWRWG